MPRNPNGCDLSHNAGELSASLPVVRMILLVSQGSARLSMNEPLRLSAHAFLPTKLCSGWGKPAQTSSSNYHRYCGPLKKGCCE